MVASLPFNILLYDWSDNWFFLTRTACSSTFSLFRNSSIYSVLLFLDHILQGNSKVAQLCLDSWRSHGLLPTRLPCPWNFPDGSTGVGCCFLLQRIIPTQGSNPGLAHCRLTHWATKEAKHRKQQVFITKSLTIEEKESHCGCGVLGYVHCFH